MRVLQHTHPGLACYAMYHIDRNDAPHRRDHIYSVLEQCELIAHRYGFDPATFEVAAIIHDIFSGSHRENHHDRAAAFARDMLPFQYGYSYEFAEEVMMMCLDHRASRHREYHSLKTMAFSAADRGPLDLAQSLVRGLGTGIVTDETLKAYVEKLREKFGPAGYARNNYIHNDFYKGSRELYWEQLNLPLNTIRWLWESECTNVPAYKVGSPIVTDNNNKQFYTVLDYIDSSTMQVLTYDNKTCCQVSNKICGFNTAEFQNCSVTI